jgi:hypothetical protein
MKNEEVEKGAKGKNDDEIGEHLKARTRGLGHGCLPYGAGPYNGRGCETRAMSA